MKTDSVLVKLNSEQLAQVIKALSKEISWLEISSIIIALCALGLSVWVAAIQRKHNRLSVAPIFNIRPIVTKKMFSFSLFNAGVGPAIITSFKYVAKNDDYSTSDSTEFLGRMVKSLKLNKDGIENWHPFSNHKFEIVILKEGLEHYFFKVEHDIKDKSHMDLILNYLKGFKVVIEYRSIYKEEGKLEIDIIN